MPVLRVTVRTTAYRVDDEAALGAAVAAVGHLRLRLLRRPRLAELEQVLHSRDMSMAAMPMVLTTTMPMERLNGAIPTAMLKVIMVTLLMMEVVTLGRKARRRMCSTRAMVTSPRSARLQLGGLAVAAGRRRGTSESDSAVLWYCTCEHLKKGITCKSLSKSARHAKRDSLVFHDTYLVAMQV